MQAKASNTKILALVFSEQHTAAFRRMVTALKLWTAAIIAKIEDSPNLKGITLVCRLNSLVIQISAMTVLSKNEGTRQRKPK